MSRILEPQFLVVHAYIHVFTGACVSSRGILFGVCLGFLSGRFRPGWFLSVLPSVRMHPLQQQKLNITFNFRFHMYEFFLKCDVTCSWTPIPVNRLLQGYGTSELQALFSLLSSDVM